MKYLALIYGDEIAAQSMTPADQHNEIAEYGQYGEWLDAHHAGKMLGGEALLPTSTAKTIRVRDGKTTVIDGPFAETKEHLGGYYLFEAKDMDEAVILAERIPGAANGCVEVRPIMVIEF
jgi:hypothetical protein